MDVAQDLAEYAAKHANNVLERDVPIEVDAGLLAAFDNTPVDEAAYADLNPHLLSLTLTSTASLLASLFTLPRAHAQSSTSTSTGPTATLPPPKTLLPREKALPKPKQPTKWERFAKEKGISHRTKEKKEWDEERGEWVSRWGMGGKNREGEEQWLHEVKNRDDADLDPASTLRAARKARVTKNLKQQSANTNRAINANSNAATDPAIEKARADKVSSRTKRKSEIDRTLLITGTATASMGRFDKKLEGEPKVKGVKRKFEANELPSGGGGAKEERERQMGVLKRVERGEGKKVRKGGEGREGDVNARKAVRYEGKQQRARQKK